MFEEHSEGKNRVIFIIFIRQSIDWLFYKRFFDEDDLLFFPFDRKRCQERNTRWRKFWIKRDYRAGWKHKVEYLYQEFRGTSGRFLGRLLGLRNAVLARPIRLSSISFQLIFGRDQQLLKQSDFKQFPVAGLNR